MAFAYAAISILVLVNHPGTRQATWLVLALAGSSLWGGALAFFIWSQGSLVSWLPNLDALHLVIWVLFLAEVLKASTQGGVSVNLRRALIGGSLLLTAVVLFGTMPLTDLGPEPVSGQARLLAMLGVPLLGLLGLEQVFRNADARQRRVLAPLALGVGTIFVIDFFVYSQAVLLSGIDSQLWLLRGALNVLAVPLIVVAVKRQPDWERELFVSRQVVFYTATLVGAGLYLLAMAGGAFIIRAVGGVWGPALQLLFLFAAALVLVYLLFSASLRRRLKVFLAKHFYRNRYDYRVEWLRFINTLAAAHPTHSLPDRCVQALAEIIGSEEGELWLARQPGVTFEPYGVWGSQIPSDAISADDVLAKFLARTRWIIDSRECELEPEAYGNEFGPGARPLPEASIFVPLMQENALIGIVRLARPAALGSLTFEDHDLLKTTGQQLAIFLAQEAAQTRLTETRQLEAFGKLTAFLMHDLKNLIAQQELVIGNARRFKHRPEFIDDAIQTIQSGVQRMRTLLERLEGVERLETKTARVELRKLLMGVRSGCADRKPIPDTVLVEDRDLWVRMDQEKLSMALTHAVRNSQDATPADGRIELRVSTEGELALIEVVDTGAGMDKVFIRDRLFKPFESTKGAKGMGIGAYQIRETLRAAGGDVEVSSEVGEGTTLRLKLPLAEPRESPRLAEASGQTAA